MNSAELSPSAGGSSSRLLLISPPDLCMLLSAKPVLARNAVRNFDCQTDFYLPLQDWGRYVFIRQTPPSSELADPMFLQL